MGKRLVRDDDSDGDDAAETNGQTEISVSLPSSSSSSHNLTSDEEALLRKNLLLLGAGVAEKKIITTTTTSSSSRSNGNDDVQHDSIEISQEDVTKIQAMQSRVPGDIAEEATSMRRLVEKGQYTPIRKCIGMLEVSLLLLKKVAVEEYQKVTKPISEGQQPGSTTNLAQFYVEVAKYLEDRRPEFEKPSVPFWAKLLSLKISALSRMRAFSITARKLESLYLPIRDGTANAEAISYYNSLSFRGAVLGVNAFERSEAVRDINMKLPSSTEEDKRIAKSIPTFDTYAGLDLFSNIMKVSRTIELFKASDALRKEIAENQSSLKL